MSIPPNFTYSPSYPLTFSVLTQTVSSDSQVKKIDDSKALNEEEKKFYKQMIDCVEIFGMDDDRALFKAADYCFDTILGTKTRNMISVKEYADLMGIDLQENTLDVSLAKDRPGVFLLSRENNPGIYFLKEHSFNGSLVYYDMQTDRFIDISQLKLKDEDKLVLLNKNCKSISDTYFGIHTPTIPVNGQFYHEKQEMGKCGIHACHAFLGYPVINNAMLSLLKLENLTCIETQNLIAKKNNTGFGPPLGRVQFHLDQMRFNLAQTSLCQAEAANAVEELLMILKLMASLKTIDPKYASLNSFEIHFCALKFVTETLPMPWREEDFSRLLEILEQEFQKLDKCKENQPVLQKLKQQRAQINNSNTLQRNDRQYIEAMLQPYERSEVLRNDYANSIEGFKRLQKALKESDRLIIGSVQNGHFYAMRKCENGAWSVIDSLLNSQERVEKPLEWLFTQFKSGYQFIA